MLQLHLSDQQFNCLLKCDLYILEAWRYLKMIFAIYMYQPISSTFISMLDMNLTHWGRDKMAAISQTTFSSAFSWMKMFELRLKFHWSLFLRVQLTIFQCWLVYRRIYESLGLNELINPLWVHYDNSRDSQSFFIKSGIKIRLVLNWYLILLYLGSYRE